MPGERVTLNLRGQSLRRWPTQVSRMDEVTALAQRYRFTDRMVLTARGYSYPTVREGALKLMETSYLAAHAFSGADLLHGPARDDRCRSPGGCRRAGGGRGCRDAPVLGRYATEMPTSR